MAKKRKEKTEEDEIDFKLPKFDEEKFLKKEKRNIKTLFISFIFGIIISVICFGFWVLLQGSAFRWELVLLVGVFNASWIRYMFNRLNIDLTDFGKKGWLGSYAIYFLTWLIILIILANPPFYDDEPPNLTVAVLPEMQELGGTVKIVANIIDNVGVEKQDITFNLMYPDGASTTPDFTFEENIFIFTFENTENVVGTYDFNLQATDTNGHSTVEINSSFSYNNNTIKIASPANADVPPGPTVTYAETIKFDVGSAVSRVYYTIDESSEINTTQEEDYYETTPKQVGWLRGENATVKVYAEIIYYFENVNREFNNTIIDTSTYYFNISNDIETGTEDSPIIQLPTFTPVQVPGFEILVFLISLAIVVLIFKFRKKKK